MVKVAADAGAKPRDISFKGTLQVLDGFPGLPTNG